MTKPFILICFLLFNLTASAQDRQVESLEKENQLLRSEIETLKKHIKLLEEENARLKPKTQESDNGTAKKNSDEGEVIGIVWELEVLKPDGSVFSTSKFLAQNGKLYVNSLEVGTYTETGNRARLDIAKNVPERAQGKAELLRISNKPPAYQGRFTNKRGENPIIRLRQVID